jgi:hypothetical protein
MNTLQTTLTALEAQLESQRNDCIEYEKNVYDKQLETLREKVSNFFISIGIVNDIIFNGTYIKIITTLATATSFSKSLELYYDIPWRSERDGNGNGHIELSWYGSRCKCSDTDDIMYLKTLGEIAFLLPTIEAEWHEWNKQYQQYSKDKRVYYSATDTTERAIRDTKSLIAKSEISTYKKVGFKCQLKERIECKRNYEIDYGTFGDYTLVQESAAIKLQYGYSKWAYCYVDYFEVDKELKRGKMLIKVKLFNSSNIAEYEVTPKFFEPFINDVYNWQTIKADQISLEAYKEFNKRATKQVAEIAE